MRWCLVCSSGSHTSINCTQCWGAELPVFHRRVDQDGQLVAVGGVAADVLCQPVVPMQA